MPRTALTRDRVVAAAAAVADRGGLAAVTMRSVGKELGVEAMSLYHHVDGKDALLDALADWAFARIERPRTDRPWRSEMVARADSARAVLRDHPWALGMLESRPSPGPSLLRHHDSVVACLLAGGFSRRLAAHAFSALDAYVYGFVLTELSLPFDSGTGGAGYARGLSLAAADHPHLVGVLGELLSDRTYRFADEFGYGLELVLDGLESRLAAEREVGP